MLDEHGQLPRKPEDHQDILGKLQVTIDPHQSLHAMPSLVEGFARLMDLLEYHVLHNETGMSFLTSDNPVVYYDPSRPEDRLFPYRVKLPDGPIELLFPIDPNTAILGLNTGRPRAVSHHRLSSTGDVKRINRLVSRFGYRFVFAADNTHGPVISKYASTSPIGSSQCYQLETDISSLPVGASDLARKSQKWTGPK